MFHNVSSTISDELHLCTDVSRTIVFGVYFLGKWFSASWRDTFKPLLNNSNELSIAFCELYLVVVAAVLL